MAVSAAFVLQNVPTNADTVRQALASLQPDGPGGLVKTGELAVTQTGTPSMGVSVAAGRAWIEGTDAAHLSGQSFGKQGKYFFLNDAPLTVSIATADATNPRIDVIYAAVQDAMYAGTNNQPVLTVAKGAPTSGATYPTNAPALPTNSIALAWVNVPANATSITNTNITTITGSPAIRNTVKHAEYTSVTASQTSGTGVNYGSLTPDTSATANNTFCTVDTTGKVTFNEPGVYFCQTKASPTAAYTSLQLWANDAGGTQQIATTGTGYGGQPFTGTCSFYVPTAGATLQFGATWNATSTANTRIKITKMQAI